MGNRPTQIARVTESLKEWRHENCPVHVGFLALFVSNIGYKSLLVRFALWLLRKQTTNKVQIIEV